MKQIKTFKELRSLANGTKVNKIENGDINFLTIVGTIPNSTGLVVLNCSTLQFIYKHDFDRDKKDVFYTTEYDAKEVGKLMIKQIEEHSAKEIEGIRAVYIDRK